MCEVDPTNGKIDKRWLLSGDLPCLGCGYNLRGLIGPVVQCPECGNGNDLRNPEPWKEVELPLGVKQREHWPALAPGLSLMVAVVVLIAGRELLYFLMQLNVRGFTLSGVGLRGVLPFGLIAVFAGGWLWLCMKWLKSADWSRGAWKVLLGTHAGTWMIFLGLTVGPSNYFLRVQPRVDAWVLLPFVMFPAGCAALIWVKVLLKKADGEKMRYREDWANWLLPVGEGGDARES
ncbi:hypothetical protein KS4_21420 [Poriferisphaera corsica]|uniref:Uncharacterized protein n=1 Tax=Poriferisphaera corsica TaxID=2528020 RepID=A0A517YV36_9BACT|nr:hypothetical protein [Poriferisphaera corsica]QDU34080.1 hypothetical protein KS4_21420 [Poriferisphaera corsica]